MATETVSFAGGAQNPFTSIPTGWTSYGTWIRSSGIGSGEIFGNSTGRMNFTTYAAGLRTITAPMTYNTSDPASRWGLHFLNGSLTGFFLSVSNTAISLFKCTADVTGTSIATTAVSNTANATFALEYNDSTGAIDVKKNGASVLTGNYTDTPTLFAGIRSFVSGSAQSFSTVTVDYTPAQTVTSINGGSPITSSQSAVAAVTTGFTGLPTTITTNATGVTCGTIGGTTNAPTWVQPIRTDGAVFPKSGTVVTYTFTNGAETANGDQTINKDADQTAVIVSSPINDDTTCLFGAIFATTGRSAANGDEVYHTVPVGMSDLVVNPDGTMEVTNAGTFDCWVWTLATGVNYYYSVTITENGVVVIPPTTRPLGGRPIRSSVTPHATNPVGGSGETRKAYGIKVSGAGTVVIRTECGEEDVTITLAAGATLPVVVTHIRDTSTATGILGYSIF